PPPPRQKLRTRCSYWVSPLQRTPRPPRSDWFCILWLSGRKNQTHTYGTLVYPTLRCTIGPINQHRLAQIHPSTTKGVYPSTKKRGIVCVSYHALELPIVAELPPVADLHKLFFRSDVAFSPDSFFLM